MSAISYGSKRPTGDCRPFLCRYEARSRSPSSLTADKSTADECPMWPEGSRSKLPRSRRSRPSSSTFVCELLAAVVRLLEHTWFSSRKLVTQLGRSGLARQGRRSRSSGRYEVVPQSCRGVTDTGPRTLALAMIVNPRSSIMVSRYVVERRRRHDSSCIRRAFRPTKNLCQGPRCTARCVRADPPRSPARHRTKGVRSRTPNPGSTMS
jgi:hypothetical protein